MAERVRNARLTTVIACGLAWPFVTLLIGANLNRAFHYDVEPLGFYDIYHLHFHLGFGLWVLVLSLGATAGADPSARQTRSSNASPSRLDDNCDTSWPARMRLDV